MISASKTPGFERKRGSEKPEKDRRGLLEGDRKLPRGDRECGRTRVYSATLIGTAQKRPFTVETAP
jgi:hypothetical protein